MSLALFGLGFFLMLYTSTKRQSRLQNLLNAADTCHIKRFKSDLNLVGDNEPINILYVIAHPDDETMFFSPSILTLQTLQWRLDTNTYSRSSTTLYLACLSKGLNCGLVRQRELFKAAVHLGILTDKILFHDFQDGAQWDPEQVVNSISELVGKWDINVLITFDSYGVSGHSNHISCYLGVKRYLERFSERRLVAYQLKSVSFLQKYLWSLDFGLFNLFRRRKSYNPSSINFFNPKPSVTFEAMELHKSQLVWFRRIYMSLSQYVYWNELERIENC